ncbi:HAMP domain-containing protein [Anaerocolumna sedimenticola]|uniref:HAMP domain-containing protein n=1 Tax=Anaerocolumna sedimenticola TaxID=2696063 RepID=A0A6P1TNU4_9FIRM|nr:histidine kinase [Anaerocolumna sedimenticola]QHQ61869.1 HAMP domain-containing protein [Anaerocolumna sedimenticola]
MKEKQGLTYRTKLIGFFLLATVITTLVGLYNYTSSRVLMKNMTDMLNKSQELTTVYNELDQIQNNLEVYLSTRSSDSLQSFYDHSNSISYNNSILKSDAGYSDRGIKIKNLTGMVDHYLKILDETVVDKRNKKINEYTAGYQEAVKEYNYIGNYIQEIMSTDLSDSAQKYIDLKKEADQTAMINYFLFGITIILISVILVLFSIEITKPISKLVSYAKEVSDGNFDVEITDEKTSSEISILYQTFHRMTISIKEYVNELKEKQRLERTLIEEKLDNLKMKNALHEAELLALQSQVNPHFIFNSINIGAKVAMLQGDDITCEYLENFADIFRYNLKGLDYNATLQEEINNVVAYMNLLITRFGDIIDFRLAEPEDDSIKNFIIPRMTLQPLVENAYIHGVSKFEDGGTIELKTAKDENRLYITISNTGDEFPEETIESILNRKLKAQKETSKKGHTTGIGLDNVLNRLRLFYEENNVMNITCVNGKTNVILSLPLNFKKETK